MGNAIDTNIMYTCLGMVLVQKYISETDRMIWEMGPKNK